MSGTEERGQLAAEGFVNAFEAEAEALGTTLDARRVLAALSGPVRPAMVEAVRRLWGRFVEALQPALHVEDA